MPPFGSAEMPFTCSVVESWTATYPDPIAVRKGDPLMLDGRWDVWDGHVWLWATNPDGKEGWIPDCLVSASDPATALDSYSALELTCRKGEVLKAERVLHGWVLCSNRRGQKGWVPQRNLGPVAGG